MSAPLTPEFLLMLAAAEDRLTVANVGWDAAMDAQYRAAAFRQMAGEISAALEPRPTSTEE